MKGKDPQRAQALNYFHGQTPPALYTPQKTRPNVSEMTESPDRHRYQTKTSRNTLGEDAFLTKQLLSSEEAIKPPPKTTFADTSNQVSDGGRPSSQSPNIQNLEGRIRKLQQEMEISLQSAGEKPAPGIANSWSTEP